MEKKHRSPARTILSDEELRTLLDRTAWLKQGLVRFVMEGCGDAVSQELAKRGSGHHGRLVTTDQDVAQVVEGIIEGWQTEEGDTIIQAFLAKSPDLSVEDRMTVKAWDRGFRGVFRVIGREGRVTEAINMVDDLPYLLVSNMNSAQVRSALGTAGTCVAARVVPLLDVWLFQGNVQPFDPSDRLLAAGMAALTARSNPALYFRNPEHLAAARQRVASEHELFLSHFGGCWITGTGRELQERWGEFMAPRSGPAPNGVLAPRFELPKPLLEREDAGMISHAEEGLFFAVGFGAFLAALADPERGRDPACAKMIKAYLEDDGALPRIFEILAGERPDELDALMAIFLDRPGFSWRRDGEVLLEERNPAFCASPHLPSSLCLHDELSEGMEYMARLEAKAGAGATNPARKGKKKKKKARRKKRR